MCRDHHPNLSISTPEYRPINLFYRSRISVSLSSGRRFMKRFDVPLPSAEEPAPIMNLKIEQRCFAFQRDDVPIPVRHRRYPVGD